MKKFFFTFLLIFLTALIFSNAAQDHFINNVFYNFNGMVDMLALDYSKIAGLYTAGGDITGSASVGHFPAFRAGATAGVMFFKNPLRFIKPIDFFGLKWADVTDKLQDAGLLDGVNFFDQNFLPIPISYYSFDIGLPRGFTIGGRFNIGPLGSVVKKASTSAEQYINDILHWSIGANFKYTIMRDYKYFPAMSVGMGTQFSYTLFDLKDIPIGNVNLDEFNPSIPATMGFYSQNSNTSIFFDFAISKRILFFQPFAGFKFVQTISYNLTKFTVNLDLSDATAEAKTTYKEEIIISNKSGYDASLNEIGRTIPVTDFIISLGFEFIIKIFRFGVEASFAAASQTGMLTLGMRFQVEDWQFAKLKKKT
ncbi:MAG: hypothetical protein JXB50_00400 [Spirochaetes bacterium]|nr:hypothetical protein [Spirochaetota bacterium]